MVGWRVANREVCMRGRGGLGCKLDFRFVSLLYGMPANIFRKPATGGMASQHLQTFERVPAAYSLFAGTVPVFHLLKGKNEYN